MNILVTGAKGFIGKNLVVELKNRKYENIFEYDIDTSEECLKEYISKCDFIFHLAGINRPENTDDFMEGNFGFTSVLIDVLKECGNTPPILITSSIQASSDNLYGKSKKAGENVIFEYAKVNNTVAYVYRLPNVFGKWCKPNYNSAVATFCHNIANNIPININDPNIMMSLVYIDDVVDEFINALNGNANKINDYCDVPTVHQIKLGEIANLLHIFKESRTTLQIPLMSGFEKVLYSTYLSYLNENDFSYPLKMNIDNRGSFTEILKTFDRGQFSVNISKAGITKGNHWHHSKNEKFLVVSGNALIQFRKIGDDKIINYNVSGEKLEVVDIPTGYTHNIINTGICDLVIFIWANEIFNPEKPDTFFEVVE